MSSRSLWCCNCNVSIFLFLACPAISSSMISFSCIIECQSRTVYRWGSFRHMTVPWGFMSHIYVTNYVYTSKTLDMSHEHWPCYFQLHDIVLLHHGVRNCESFLAEELYEIHNYEMRIKCEIVGLLGKIPLCVWYHRARNSLFWIKHYNVEHDASLLRKQERFSVFFCSRAPWIRNCGSLLQKSLGAWPALLFPAPWYCSPTSSSSKSTNFVIFFSYITHTNICVYWYT